MELKFTFDLLVLTMAFTTSSLVTGLQMTIQPNTGVLVETQSFTIRCSETIPIYQFSIKRNDQLLVSYGPKPGTITHAVVKWSDTAGDLKTRAEVTGDWESSTKYMELFINNTKCDDSAMFECESSPSTSVDQKNKRNITVHGVAQLPRMTGGRECNSFNGDKDCDKCIPANPQVPKPKYVKLSEQIELTCAGPIALPANANNYRWYKKRTGDPGDGQEIRVNIKRDMRDADGPSCYGTGSSTLTYTPDLIDVGLILICELTYDNTGTQVSPVQSFKVNTPVCVEGLEAPASPCHGDDCNSADGSGGAGTVAFSASAIAAQVILFLITRCILCQ